MGPISASEGAGAATASSSITTFDLPNQCENLTPRLMRRVGLMSLGLLGRAAVRAGCSDLRGIVLTNIPFAAAPVLPPVAREVRPMLRSAAHAAAPCPAAADPLD